MTDDDIIAIRDEHLPSQGEGFDCVAFARAVLAKAAQQPKVIARGRDMKGHFVLVEQPAHVLPAKAPSAVVEARWHAAVVEQCELHAMSAGDDPKAALHHLLCANQGLALASGDVAYALANVGRLREALALIWDRYQLGDISLKGEAEEFAGRITFLTEDEESEIRSLAESATTGKEPG